MVTITYPTYGPAYTYCWIKDNDGNLIFETTDAQEYNSKLSEYGESGILVSYGCDGRQDVTGYMEAVLTEKEYYESDFSKRNDVTIKWNQ